MKCRICTRCGGNQFKAVSDGWKCEYCDTVFVPEPSDFASPEEYVNFADIKDKKERLKIANESRGIRWEYARRCRLLSLRPLILVAIGLLLLLPCIHEPALLWLPLLLMAGGASIFYFFTLKDFRAASRTMKDLEDSVGS